MIRSTLRRFDARFHQERSFSAQSWFVVAGSVIAAATAAFVVLVVVRIYGPTVHPDEFGFLANGQVMIGHDEAKIYSPSFYPAGYGIITGLGALLTGSIEGSYRVALVVNVVFVVALAWATMRLAARGFGASKAASRLAGALVLVAPGTSVSALYSWPEVATRLGFVGLVALVVCAAQRLSTFPVVALCAYAGLLPALHGRFTLMVPVVCLVVGWWGLKRDISRLWALAGIGSSAVAYWLTYLLNSWVKSTLYPTSLDQENRLLRRLADYSMWFALIRRIAGQSWYVLATSLGIAGIAVGWALVRIWGRGRRDLGAVRTDPERLALAVIVACMAGLLFTGGLQLLHGNRADHLIYGRYVETLVPVLWMLGVVALERASIVARRSWSISLALVAFIALCHVVADQGDAVKGGWVRRTLVFPNAVGVDAAQYIIQPGIITFTLLFVVVGALVWWLHRWKGALAIVAMIALLAAGSVVSGERSVLGRQRIITQSGTSVERAIAGGTQRLGYDNYGDPTGFSNDPVRPGNDRGYYFLRYKLHPVPLDRIDVSSPAADIPAEYRCVYARIEEPPRVGEWAAVADEPAIGRTLFMRVGAESC